MLLGSTTHYAGFLFCGFHSLALPLEVPDGDDLDGELLQESEDGRSVKVPQLICHECHLKPIYVYIYIYIHTLPLILRFHCAQYFSEWWMC